MNVPKILIINPFGIGDVIFSTPLIGALRESYPTSFIGYVCNRRAYEVIKSNPDLNNIYIYEKDDYRTIWQRSRLECSKKIFSFLRSIKREKFNIAIDLSLGYQYSLLLKFIGVRNRLGFNFRNRGRFLTSKIDIEGFDSKHVIEYYLEMLRLLGMDPNSFAAKPKLYLEDADATWANNFLKDNGVDKSDLLIGMMPGCGASWGIDAHARRWGRREFADVGDSLIERRGAKIILLGNSEEISICMDIQKMMRHKVVMACGKTRLGGALGLLNKCNLVITNDGGPLHMAAGIGVKTISIFGPVDERIYGPYPLNSNHIVIFKNDIPCRPCYKKFKYRICNNRICLQSIKPKEVLEAADVLLADN